jgi:uncharacterized membrane protein YdbT with pleckstrin-like domain
VTSPTPAGPPGPPGPVHQPGPPPAPPAADYGSWQRLHPLSPVVRAGRHLLTIVILLFVLFFANHNGAGGDLVGNAAVVGIALAAGVVSWLVTRWQVADGVLRIETGLVRRQSRRFPLSQVQAIDVVQTGVARVLGLAELRLRMAGADSSGGRLASLPLADAEQLRQRLLAMARTTGGATNGSATNGTATNGTATNGTATNGSATNGSATNGSVTSSGVASSGVARSTVTRSSVTNGSVRTDGTADAAGTGAGAARPDRLLFRVRSSRLAAAIALSRTGAYAAVVIAAFACVVAFTARTSFVIPFLPFGIGIILAVWRQFNGDYGTVVVAAADGLMLRSGLIQTTAETIRPGRVQGVRLVEPLLWRPLGWCRLEVDVAGPRQRRENRSESQRLRALIPAGTRAEAGQLISELLSSVPLASHRAPRSALWKAPLTYHFLAWGGDDQYVAAARGRICRTTTWVPLEKVQSVRWAQGPLQRRLGLASVRLDVAGKRVTASIQDRSAAEAREIFGKLPDLTARARRQQRAA